MRPAAPENNVGFVNSMCPSSRLLVLALDRSIRAATTGDVGGELAQVVDEPVFQGLLGGEPVVAVTIDEDLLNRLAGLLCSQFRHSLLHVEDDLGLRLDVGSRTAEATGRLVQQHPGVRGD